MKLLITGVTGYIGGSVARRLVGAGHDVSGVVRSADAAPALEAQGIRPIVTDLNAYEPVRRAIARAEGVIHAADSDNAHFVASAIETLEGTGKVFIHTSGSSIVGDKAMGERSDRVHDGNDFTPLLEKTARVEIDRAVLRAAGRGIRAVVIVPTMIYGEGLGIKKESIQVPMLTRLARETGAARFIGRGENIWSNVHIADLAELYELALGKAPAGSHYFVENGEASLKAVARAIHARLGLPGEARSMSIDEAIGHWGPDAAQFAFGSNSRVSSRRARAELGWEPRRDSLLDDIRA